MLLFKRPPPALGDEEGDGAVLVLSDAEVGEALFVTGFTLLSLDEELPLLHVFEADFGVLVDGEILCWDWFDLLAIGRTRCVGLCGVVGTETALLYAGVTFVDVGFVAFGTGVCGVDLAQVRNWLRVKVVCDEMQHAADVLDGQLGCVEDTCHKDALTDDACNADQDW